MMSIFRSPDLAVDLGTATTRVAGGAGGIGQTPSVSDRVRALHRGVIVNGHAAAAVLRPLLRSRRRARFARQRVLACAPTDVTPSERHAVRACILEAGASSVIVVPEPLAAAVGSGIDIGSRYGKLLVDIGEGVTDCAIIRDGSVVVSNAERVGCADLRRIIQSAAEAAGGVSIDEAEAERLLRKIGLSREGEELCHGTSVDEAVEFPLSIPELNAELWPVIDRILITVRALLSEIPASLGAEVIEDGIFLTGGGALLHGMRDAVASETAIKTCVVADPLGAVISGARTMLPFASTLRLWNSWGGHQRACRAPGGSMIDRPAAD